MPGHGLGNDESVTRRLDPAEDGRLQGEWMLRGCSMLEHGGRSWPSLGRIALIARIGQGGMGVVYRGVNPRLGTEVAVKILPPTLGQARAEFADRFVREARIAARLKSEHLVAVTDVDHDEPTGCHFLVMEFVKGTTAVQWLQEIVAAGRRGARESDALDVAIAAARGLAVAHVEGIVHRDVKPGNVLIPEGADGRPQLAKAKLSDLGLARGDSGDDESLTGTQIALGTPGYMAPEQAQDAHSAGKPADVFSTGATLYAFLTGVAPFRGSTPVEAIVKTVKGEFRPLLEVRDDVSAATAAVVARCLAPEPSDRFPDAPALLLALEICRASLGAGATGAADAAARIAALAAAKESGKPLQGTAAAAASTVTTPAVAPSSQPSSRTQVAAANSRTFVPTTSRSSKRRTLVAAALALVAVGAAAAVAVPAWRDAQQPSPSAPVVRKPPIIRKASHATDGTNAPADAASEHHASSPSAAEASPKPPATASDATSGPARDAASPPDRTRPTTSGPQHRDAPNAGAAETHKPPEKPAAAPAPQLPSDPVEAAQVFDLGGLPGREDSFTEQQLRKFAGAHRRGDLASALDLQRKLAQFYLRIGDTARARVARDRAEVLDRETAERASAQQTKPKPEETKAAGDAPSESPPPFQPPPPPPPPPPPGGGKPPKGPPPR